jgi:hypothetical protein
LADFLVWGLADFLVWGLVDFLVLEEVGVSLVIGGMEASIMDFGAFRIILSITAIGDTIVLGDTSACKCIDGYRTNGLFYQKAPFLQKGGFLSLDQTHHL